MHTPSSAGRGVGVWANNVVESRRAANKIRIAKIDGRLQRLLALNLLSAAADDRVGHLERYETQISAQNIGREPGAPSDDFASVTPRLSPTCFGRRGSGV